MSISRTPVTTDPTTTPMSSDPELDSELVARGDTKSLIHAMSTVTCTRHHEGVEGISACRLLAWELTIHIAVRPSIASLTDTGIASNTFILGYVCVWSDGVSMCMFRWLLAY